jgi:hypothetical protein
MAIVYLDVDDEITFAASRIRSAGESRVALVLPAGSRLGTSRINFRLLAREAQSGARNLSIVCPEAPTRALAASAGLPVFASVSEYETALATPPEPTAPVVPMQQDAQLAGAESVVAVAAAVAVGPSPAAVVGPSPAAAGGPPAAAGPPAAGVPDHEPAAPEPVGTAAGGEASSSVVAPRTGQPPSLPVVGGRGGRDGRGGPRTGAIVGIGLIALLALVGAIGAYVLLPSASVSVVVRPEGLGPVDLTVTADPAATTTDPVAGVVPADRPSTELSASGTFEATGKKVEETKATGSVRWQNCDPTRSYRIPAGTVVRTSAGIGFAIDETVFLPVAILAGNPPSITCQTRDVPVTATKAGEAGNVAARTITSVPASLNSVVVRATNPDPTSGGSRTETPRVTQKDVDAAAKALTAELDAQLAAAIADPTQLAAGRIVFEDTASRTEAVPTVDPTSLVGQEVEAFELGLQSTGSVTAVDPEVVRALARQRLLDAIQPGQQLVDGSIQVDLGEPAIEGEAVTFPVTAQGQVVEPVDEAVIRAEIAGLPVADAEAILAGYGDAIITVWPEWVTTIPTYGFRLDVTVTTDVPTGSDAGAPVPSGADTPTPSGSEPP